MAADAAAAAGAALWVLHDPPEPSAAFCAAVATVAPGARLRAQGSGDLGARLARGLAGSGSRIALGSDAPDLPPARVGEAWARLEQAPAVLGPAPDGGYYLLGLAAGVSAAFLGASIRWSSRHTLADTQARLQASGQGSARLLDRWEDVDDLASLRRLGHRLAQASPEVAPATRAWLAGRAQASAQAAPWAPPSAPAPAPQRGRAP